MNENNIIIIVLDTLRNDHSYILKNNLSKNNFIKYKNIIAPSPWTTPTHASIFTGMYPLIHGCHETYKKKDLHVILSKKLDLLNVLLKNNGYI